MKSSVKTVDKVASTAEKEERNASFIWEVELGPRRNAIRLGQALAAAHENLYRTSQGLIEARHAEGKVRVIDKAGKLAPILIDRLNIKTRKNDKIIGDLPPDRNLNALLSSEEFLRQFRPVDQVSFFPIYLQDFTLVQPGYHDGGEGRRILYLGPQVQITNSMEGWGRFLNVMEFDGQASRTNTIAAAVTLLLRHHFLGQKPLFLVTANQSHAGKGTVIDAIRGRVPKASILYQDKDWPMEVALQRQLNGNLEVGLIDLDNVRQDSSGRGTTIRSALLESLVTSAEIKMASATGGTPITRSNDLVVAINTNEGTASPDLLNRSLWIHLAPQGDIHERRSAIGNPKHEFLPQYQQQMEAELHGLIARWRAAGCPLADVYHPMAPWAKTIGGILEVAGYKGFLANYGQAARQIDPQRQAVAILGAAKPGVAMRSKAWAKIAVKLGLAKTLFSAADRDTDKGRQRGIGVVFKRYLDVPLEAETETKQFQLRLSKKYKRWKRGENPCVKYTFKVEAESQVYDEQGNQKRNEPSPNGKAKAGKPLRNGKALMPSSNGKLPKVKG